ncbi:MAG: cytochrome P450 family protein [Pseudonocardiaceae bacterium]
MPTVSELGRRLQLVHAAQWLSAAHGDPYAEILLGYDDDPYSRYTAIRERGELWRSRDGVWVTAHHRLGRELLDHPALGRRGAQGSRWPQPVIQLERTVLCAERAEIDRLHEAGGPLLGADIVDRYRSVAEDVCRRVLDGLGAEADLVTEVAEPIAVEVLADLCNLSGPERARLIENCRWGSPAQDSLLCPQQLAPTRRMLAAIDELRVQFGAAASGPSAANAGMLLALVGVRGAADLIAKAAFALLSHPWQWSKLAADPGQAVRAVTEALRHDPPVHLAALVARRDVELARTLVPAGSQIVVLIGGANRDPEVFPEPASFELDRSTGQGLPPCPGSALEVVAPFSTTVAEVALRALASWFPRLSRSSPELRRRRAPVTRGLLHLPVDTGISARTDRSPEARHR